MNEYSLRGSPRWPLIERPGVEGPHGACRAWSPGAWSNWAEGTLEEREAKSLGWGEGDRRWVQAPRTPP